MTDDTLRREIERMMRPFLWPWNDTARSVHPKEWRLFQKAVAVALEVAKKHKAPGGVWYSAATLKKAVLAERGGNKSVVRSWACLDCKNADKPKIGHATCKLIFKVLADFDLLADAVRNESGGESRAENPGVRTDTTFCDAKRESPTEPPRRLRDESTPEGRKAWAAVDKAADRAPQQFKECGCGTTGCTEHLSDLPKGKQCRTCGDFGTINIVCPDCNNGDPVPNCQPREERCLCPLCGKEHIPQPLHSQPKEPTDV